MIYNSLSLALTAAFLWASVNVIDKHVLTKYIKDPVLPALALGLIGFILGIGLMFIYGVAELNSYLITLGLLSGILYTLSSLSYLKALTLGDVSQLIPIFFTAPILLIPIDIIFLNETFSLGTLLGIILLILGAVGINLNKSFKVEITPALYFIVLSTILYSLTSVLNKELLTSLSPIDVLSLTRITAILPILPFFFTKKSAIKDLYNSHKKRPFIIMTITELINLLAVFAITAAFALGSVSTVTALTSFQALFVLILGYLLTKLNPNIKLDKLSNRAAIQRLICIIILVSGSFLVN